MGTQRPDDDSDPSPEAPTDHPTSRSHGDAVDLVVRDADVVVTMDAQRTELTSGWVAIDGGVVVATGSTSGSGPSGSGPSGFGPSGSGPSEPPAARRTESVPGCVVTPGLVNTHHHIFQNLTRSFAPATDETLFGWLTTLYPRWSLLDEDAAYLSAWVGCAELALGGCTTTMDHLYVHPKGGGDLITAEVQAARELGVRFHATRGSMSRSRKDGGLPPDSVVQDDDTILAESERLIAAHHDRSRTAMTQIALAPCSPFSVTPELMSATAELAERFDVRLHTHLAEDGDEDAFCLETYGCRPLEYFEDVGWASDRSWVAHCIYPNVDEIERMGRWGTGVAHCPSSNALIAGGLAPVAEFLDAGVPVGIGCDGSASTDCASLWLETRGAMLLARLRNGPASFSARAALELATLGSAACLGRQGEIGQLTPGACGDLVVWRLDGVAFAGALSDPVDALFRCGPVGAHHTVIAGEFVVADGHLVSVEVDDMLARHRVVAARLQGLD